MKYFNFILVVALFALVLIPEWHKTVCDEPLSYAVGQFDSGFGLEQEAFKDLLLESERVWEDAVGRNLFNYNEQADFKVNLIFDERQERTMEEQRLRETIQSGNASYESLVQQFESKNQQFEQKLAAYERDVQYWNSRGGAPSGEYERLQREKAELGSMASELNALSEKINSMASNYNETVKSYNTQFSVPQTFDQGQYDGLGINIYQFTRMQDLKLVLVHELGHALNIDHVEDPEAIMYHLLKSQPTDPVRLAPADLQALRTECRLN